MLEEALQGYQHFLSCVQQRSQPGQVIAAFGEYQLLCALREGPFGVTGLNDVVQARDAKRPFPQCAQKLVFAKCGDDLSGLTALLHAAQKMLVSLESLLKHSLILFPALQRSVTVIPPRGRRSSPV